MGRGGLGTGAKWGICIASTVVLIVTIGLLAGSWAVLTPQEYGIKYNRVTLTVDDETIHSAGRLYVGVGGSFFKFPKKLQYVEFSAANGNSLDVWSADGQQVFVEASFYYGLQVANLFNLFRLYKTNFHQVVVGIAAETIRDVATAYNTLDYFTNRSAIDTAMTTALTRQLATGAYADVSLFNLLAIDVPDAFDQAVQDKVLTAADVITLEQTRLSQVIRSTIAVTDAYADANVTVIVANATAQGTVIRNQAEADAKVQYMTARGASLGQLSADLNFTTSKHLLTYLYADIIRGNSKTPTTLAVNVNAATVRV